MQECSDSAVIIHPLLADNLINRGRNLICMCHWIWFYQRMMGERGGEWGEERICKQQSVHPAAPCCTLLT